MKKFLSLFLATIMVLFTFAGCKGKSEDTLQTPEVTEATDEVEETVDETDAEYEEFEEPVSKPDTGFETRKASNWKTAYKYYLEDYDNYIKELNTTSEGFTNEIRFWIDYLNDDDVPELFVSTGTCHANGVKVIFYNKTTQSINVYPKHAESSYSNYGYGAYGNINYIQKEGIIVSFTPSMSCCFMGVYDFSSGKEITIWNALHKVPDPNIGSKEQFLIEMSEYQLVSKEEYSKQYKKYVPKETVVAPYTNYGSFKKGSDNRKYQTDCFEENDNSYVQYLNENTYDLTQENINKVLK